MPSREPHRKPQIAIDPRYIVPGLSRGLALLQLFPRSKPAKTLAELAAGLRACRARRPIGWSTRWKPTASSARDPETRRYRLTSKTLDLGFRISARAADHRDRAAVPAQRSATARNAAAHVAILDGWHAVYLARALPNGRACQQPAARRAAAGAHDIERPRSCSRFRTRSGCAASTTDCARRPRGAQAGAAVQDFNAQVAADRKRGYVFHRSTVDPGLVSLAFPIRDHELARRLRR